MSNQIVYKGHVIEPTTRLKEQPHGWTLQVRITPEGRRTGIRHCRGRSSYATEQLAIERCLEFGRRIVDGKLRPIRRPAS